MTKPTRTGRTAAVTPRQTVRLLREVVARLEVEQGVTAKLRLRRRFRDVPCPGTCPPPCRIRHREMLPGYGRVSLLIEWDDV